MQQFPSKTPTCTTTASRPPTSAPDPYRNATILNTIFGYDHFDLETSTTFQQFR